MMVPNPLDPAQRQAVEEFRLGDAVAAMAKAAGLKETTGCGCARRRATLNRWTPAWLSQLLGRLGRVGSRPAR